MLSRVGNTGIPGIWLFHTGNRYSFDNIVPASIGGLLATPPAGGHGFSLVRLFSSFNVQSRVVFLLLFCFVKQHTENPSDPCLQDTTTPEYGEFEEYRDNTYDTDNQEEDEDYTLTGGDPEFQLAPGAGRDHSESPEPEIPDGSPTPSEDSGPPVSHGREGLTSEPSHSSEPAEGRYAPPNPPERVAEGGDAQAPEQQPQVAPALLHSRLKTFRKSDFRKPFNQQMLFVTFFAAHCCNEVMKPVNPICL